MSPPHGAPTAFVNYKGKSVVGDAAFGRCFGITALPVTLLIDRQGRVADSHAGMVVKDAWEREIQALLRESPQ